MFCSLHFILQLTFYRTLLRSELVDSLRRLRRMTEDAVFVLVVLLVVNVVRPMLVSFVVDCRVLLAVAIVNCSSHCSLMVVVVVILTQNHADQLGNRPSACLR